MCKRRRRARLELERYELGLISGNVPEDSREEDSDEEIPSSSGEVRLTRLPPKNEEESKGYKFRRHHGIRASLFISISYTRGENRIGHPTRYNQ